MADKIKNISHGIGMNPVILAACKMPPEFADLSREKRCGVMESQMCFTFDLKKQYRAQIKDMLTDATLKNDIVEKVSSQLQKLVKQRVKLIEHIIEQK